MLGIARERIGHEKGAGLMTLERHGSHASLAVSMSTACSKCFIREFCVLTLQTSRLFIGFGLPFSIFFHLFSSFFTGDSLLSIVGKAAELTAIASYITFGQSSFLSWNCGDQRVQQHQPWFQSPFLDEIMVAAASSSFWFRTINIFLDIALC